MSLMRWSPASDLAGLHSALDRLFSDVFGEPFPRSARKDGDGERQMATYHLPVNIAETKNGYRIEAPVPGFRPEDVEITFTDGILTINAKRKEEQKREEGNYLRHEVAFGNYVRQISVPGEVRANDITANFDNGVLVVEVPRAAKPQPKRIEVKPNQAKMEAAAGKRS